MLGTAKPTFALAWADVSTGDTAVIDIGIDALGDELARIDPAELLMTDRTRAALRRRARAAARRQPGAGRRWPASSTVRHPSQN
jgi:DNA mismatch repair ATPase MutS